MTTIVLVHGAFADGSTWNKVTPLLQEAGLNVISVQNSLESLAGDVAATQRAVELATDDVVLVGHSWGGVVITEAGTSDKVKSLVYIAAFAPDVGQNIPDAVAGTEPPPGVKAFTPDAHGYISLPRQAVLECLAPDVDEAEANLMFVNQTPINRAALGTAVTVAAWKSTPTFYAVSMDDRMTPTTLQQALARKIGATTIELDSSHVPQLSQPQAVAELIILATDVV